jgi:dTDP-D-glucose 4,6-dehydratase
MNMPHVLAGKPVLVTGGAGFIGSQLVGDLLALGADVRVLDNESRGTKANLEDVGFEIREGRNYFRADLREESGLRYFKDMHTVYHLAADVGGIAYKPVPDEGERKADNGRFDSLYGHLRRPMSIAEGIRHYVDWCLSHEDWWRTADAEVARRGMAIVG